MPRTREPPTCSQGPRLHPVLTELPQSGLHRDHWLTPAKTPGPPGSRRQHTPSSQPPCALAASRPKHGLTREMPPPSALPSRGPCSSWQPLKERPEPESRHRCPWPCVALPQPVSSKQGCHRTFASHSRPELLLPMFLHLKGSSLGQREVGGAICFFYKCWCNPTACKGFRSTAAPPVCPPGLRVLPQTSRGGCSSEHPTVLSHL